MSPAPITLFVYKRLELVKKVVKSLHENKESIDSDLIIYSDGAKTHSEFEEVAKVRSYLHNINGFRLVNIVEREENFGLAKNIISGVTEVLGKYSRIIVLEDDIVVSPYFLYYMNSALDYYESHDEVVSIHGYVYPLRIPMREPFFLKGADCWGWATWRRGWDLFESDGNVLIEKLKEKKLLNKFDFGGAHPYTKMLKGQIAGKNNSWAIRWYASALIHDKLTLYPAKSLVENIGANDTGTHFSFVSNAFSGSIELDRPEFIAEIKESQEAYRKFLKYFLRLKLRLIFDLMRSTIAKACNFRRI